MKGFKYYFAVVVAFTIYGMFSLPLRAIDTYDSLDILLTRVSLSSVLLLGVSFTFRRKITLDNINLFKNFKPDIRSRVLWVNLVSSLMLAGNWYLFIYVMNRISVNATSLAYMICPLITTVLAYIFLRDRLTAMQWLAVFLSLVSCFILAFGNLKDVFYSFIVGLSYAVYLVLQKNNNQLDRFFTLAFQICFAALLLLPLFSFQHEMPLKGSFFYGIILLIAVVFTIIPMYLNVYALDGLSSSTAGIFIYLNPILSFVLAVFYFHEEMDVFKLISYALVLFSVILFNYKILGRIFVRPKN